MEKYDAFCGRMDTIKEKVRRLLEQKPKLRDCDKALIFAYWNTHDNTDLKMPEHKITKAWDIVRFRQRLVQEDKERYQPLDLKVRKARERNQRRMRKRFGR